MTDLQPIARIQNLVVNYGAFTAINNLTVNIPQGCVGLLGPNGAGKTTLIKTILGFVKPASGSAEVLGEKLTGEDRTIRQRVGLMPEQDCHIPGMSAVSFVAFCGELCGMPAPQALRRAHEVLEHCGLGEARYRNIETYSTGMKQRVKLAQALVHGPKLLLLDEPTNGLDPAGREHMLQLIQSITHDKGLSVIISSHLLPDIERCCEHLVVVVQGQLRAAGTIAQLKEITGGRYDVELRERSEALEAAMTQKEIHWERMKFGTYRIQLAPEAAEANRIVLQMAKAANAQVRGFQVARRTLEEAFIESIKSA